MSELVLLGIDTGGTNTDAVIVTDEPVPSVLTSAKTLTTHHDLSSGITDAMAAVTAGINPARIALVSISTTLATNAIVENQGGPVCLITMGFGPDDLTRAGLADALGDGVSLTVPGGHTSHGEELEPLDLVELDRLLDELDADGFTDRAAGFAVVGQFAVRNPSHETAVRDHLRKRYPSGITCSHELSAKLNGPKRAVTSVLNAGLVGLVRDLVIATRTSMAAHGIDAPLMMVKGDGWLISAELAVDRPIETILSGPAASVIGAQHLARLSDPACSPASSVLERAIVSDIGGTTTDIAVVADGAVRVRPEGASVGGYETMVEAVDMHTIGLGGDSELSIDDTGPTTRIRLGPRRVVPIAVLAKQHPDAVAPALEEQIAMPTTPHLAGQFALIRRSRPASDGRDQLERSILEGLAEGPVALRDLLPTRRHEIALDRLVRSGVVTRSAFTPTDAAHVLGLHRAFDTEASRRAATLLARTRDRRGEPIATDADDLSNRTVVELQQRTAEAVIRVALDADALPAEPLDPIVTAGLDHHRGHLDVDLRLASPLVGLGASAPSYYPAVADRLGTESVLSPHAGVANAIGAIVGKVRVRRQATITRKKNGTYMADGVGFAGLDEAAAATEAALSTDVRSLARRAGATNVDLETTRADNVAMIAGQQVFVDATITVVGSGRPTRRNGSPPS